MHKGAIYAGLTGSIGMGKSTVAAMLKNMGVPVFDSDAEVRRLLTKDFTVIGEIVKVFPDVWDRKAKAIDRSKLAGIVFDDWNERKKLETIIHPFVWKAQSEFARHCYRCTIKLMVFDIPLLFETGAEKRVDKVVCVTAPPFVQYRRVTGRPGFDDDLFFKILNTQMPDREKRRRSDFVIHTGLNRARTFRDIKAVVNKLRGLLASGPSRFLD